MAEPRSHFRTCNICEAMCGIEIVINDQDVISIKPDRNDPFSKGHICPKAVALQDYHKDPDRLKVPLRKAGSGWEEISWDSALAEIGDRMRAIQESHGKDSVGAYLGNPNAHNLGNAIFLPHFFKALQSKSRFSSASADQLPHHVASTYMFGAGMAIPIPDIDRTHYMIIIGANPVISNGSMMSGAGMPTRIKNIQARGGKVVVIDPRRTETARIASEHLFISPETDALLLAALIKTITDAGRADLRHLDDIIKGHDQLLAAIEPFTPENVSAVVGIPAGKIRTLALEFASAPSAVCYSRMGASTQTFGGLCQWLTNVLNIITGNFDREGGAMFPQPAFDLLTKARPTEPESLAISRTRVAALPCYNGERPIAALADEILTPGAGQIRAMFTIAGNPVLSAPNGERLAEAFGQLDFMVSVDIYLNETTRHADIILPAATGLEISHFDVFFNSFAVRNTAKYSRPAFEIAGQQKHDWQILKALAACLTGVPDDGTTPEMVLDAGLKGGVYGAQGMSLQTLLDNPHGVDLGPLRPCARQRIKTIDGRINLAPAIYLRDLSRLLERVQEPGLGASAEFPFKLIGRRLVNNHNTWTHNSQRLIKGKNHVTLQMNSQDAERLNIAAGTVVELRSRTGQACVEVAVDNDIMPGVVSLPQGWGHNHQGTAMRVAETKPGISINCLTDAGRVDPLTGNAAFNGTPVAVEPALKHRTGG